MKVTRSPLDYICNETAKMIWAYPENVRRGTLKNKLYMSSCRKEGSRKRKGRPKTICMDGISEIMAKMGLAKNYWRDSENWQNIVTVKIEVGAGRCEIMV